VAQEFLERLEALLGKLTSAGFKDVKLECKHFFSGAAVYADGTICMSWTPVGFAMKLPEKLREELVAQRGAKSLRYFPKGPIKKHYVVLPNPMLSELKTLRRLVKATVEYALSQRVPPRRKKGHITRRSSRRAKRQARSLAAR